MTYIRHRSRMVQQSVFEDLQDTLIACRWIVGTTTRQVRAPGVDRLTAPAVITTTSADIFKLADGHPITLLDYFPNAQGESTGITAPNTFAIDNGRPGDASQVELGSNLLEQPYLFNFAFFATSDAVADAVFSDLKDRYEGRIVGEECIALYDYLADPDTVAEQMEIETFRYSRDLENIAPNEVHLFFGELTLIDVVD